MLPKYGTTACKNVKRVVFVFRVRYRSMLKNNNNDNNNFLKMQNSIRNRLIHFLKNVIFLGLARLVKLK